MKKPSERIQEIYFERRGNGADDDGIWIRAIQQYLDELTACQRGEHKDEVWNDQYKCTDCGKIS